MRAEDVESALALAGGATPLPTLVEEETGEESAESLEVSVVKRGRGRPAKGASKELSKAKSSPSTLNVISEEAVLEPEPSKPTRGKRKQSDDDDGPSTPTAKRVSRR